MTGQRITFDDFAVLDLDVARRNARDPNVKPLWRRVTFAALGWANLIGHAEFNAHGLTLDGILSNLDPLTGEVSTPPRQTVNRAIREAVDAGDLAPDSNRECLVLSPWWQKAGGKVGRTCAHHGIFRRPHRNRKRSGEDGERNEKCSAPEQKTFRDVPPATGDVEALYESNSLGDHEQAAPASTRPGTDRTRRRSTTPTGPAPRSSSRSSVMHASSADPTPSNSTMHAMEASQ